MTTVEEIRFAYSSTWRHQKNIPIEKCFKDKISSALYDILIYMRLEKSPFSARFLNHMGPVIILYKIGDFEIIIKEFETDVFPFNTVESFAKWLNDQELKILDAAKSLSETDDEIRSKKKKSNTVSGIAGHDLEAGDVVTLDYGRIKWYKKLLRFLTFGWFKPKPIILKFEVGEVTETSFTME